MTDPDRTFVIAEREGFTPRIGVLVAQLENARHYLRLAVRDLDVAGLDAEPAGAVNSVGALLAHLAAAERMFAAMTFEGRRFDEEDEEERRFAAAFRFEGHGRARPLASYLAELDGARARTLRGLAERDDAWLDTPTPFGGRPANLHYYWFHFLQDEVRHTGQITLLRKYLLPGARPDFSAYG